MRREDEAGNGEAIGTGAMTARMRWAWLFRIVVATLRHPLAVWRQCRSLLKAQRFSPHPRLAFRMAEDVYSRAFGASQRGDCAAHHYATLMSRLPVDVLAVVMGPGLVVWRAAGDAADVSIVLQSGDRYNSEGEATLRLLVGAREVYRLAFVICPAHIFDTPGPGILVCQVQGIKNEFEGTRLVTKQMHEVAPPLLLLGAVQGVAQAFGVRTMVGVRALDQICYRETHHQQFMEAYDDFWRSVGAYPIARAAFCLDVPMQELPLSRIRSKQRSRVRKRRALRRQLALAVAERLVAASRL